MRKARPNKPKDCGALINGLTPYLVVPGRRMKGCTAGGLAYHLPMARKPPPILFVAALLFACAAAAYYAHLNGYGHFVRGYLNGLRGGAP